MLGVILCGGNSTRMGTDKGLLTLHDNTWAQTAYNKLAQLQFDIVISVNNNQYNHYSKTFAKNQLVVDNELLQIRGPLTGLLSVHLQYPGEDLFILACDMPLMEVAILKELNQHYTPVTKNTVYIFSNDGEPEPLCGIYTATALAHIHQLYSTRQLIKHSMKFALEHVDTKTFPIGDDDKKYFTNFNAHAQLNGL